MPAHPNFDQYTTFTDFYDPKRDWTYRIDLSFMSSKWACVFGRGCKGLDGQPVVGCCTIGAWFTDKKDRANTIEAASKLTPEQWEMHPIPTNMHLDRKGYKKYTCEVDEDAPDDEYKWKTKKVTRTLEDGTKVTACIFVNVRPDQGYTPGCALHNAAAERGEHPYDGKPYVCGEAPLLVTHKDRVTTVAMWRNQHWNYSHEDGGPGAYKWWCTEDASTYVNTEPVYVAEKTALLRVMPKRIYEEMCKVLGVLDFATIFSSSNPVPVPLPTMKPTGDGTRADYSMESDARG